MLFVLFHLGLERYAIAAQRVVEVVPFLALKKLPQSQRGVAGMFLYRGRPVLALDLCELTIGRPAQEHFSTRIIIINYSTDDGEEQLLGLIAERVTDTMKRTEKEILAADKRVAGSTFLGPVLTDANGAIQVINPEKLLHDGLRARLFHQSLESGHATH